VINDTLLFDSYTSPVPEVRRDLQRIPVQLDNREVIYLHDALGYASPDFALDQSVEPILSLINGHTSVRQIKEMLNGQVTDDQLLEFIQMLDQNRILHSKHLKLFAGRMEKDFEASAIRKPVLTDEGYPQSGEELNRLLSEVESNKNFESVSFTNKPSALYAPHIDLRVGLKQYYEAFSRIRELKPKRVVILATSHFSGYYPDLYENSPFIGSNKMFSVMDESFQPDNEYLNVLNNRTDELGFTLSDRAHRLEHSIEMHLMMLSVIWKHPYKIVPILVGSLDPLFYHQSGELSERVDNFTDAIHQLHDDDTFYLISGDLSHVGKKFGDPVPAGTLKEKVEPIDQQFLQHSVSGEASNLLKEISSHYDSTRICGFPPLFTYLKAQADTKGEIINYHWWDEDNTASAVSFGSILYW
jgi:MEMO1 family protein